MTTAEGDHGAALDLLADLVEPAGRVEGLDGSTVAGGPVGGRRRAVIVRADSQCNYCGRRMSPGRHGRRRYCTNSCRTAAYKARRRAQEEFVTTATVVER